MLTRSGGGRSRAGRKCRKVGQPSAATLDRHSAGLGLIANSEQRTTNNEQRITNNEELLAVVRLF